MAKEKIKVVEINGKTKYLNSMLFAELVNSNKPFKVIKEVEI